MLRYQTRGAIDQSTSSSVPQNDPTLQQQVGEDTDIGLLPMIDSKPKRKSVAKKMMKRLNVFRKKSSHSKSSTTRRTKSSDFSIASNFSNSDGSNRDTLLMRQQQEFEKTSLATLGAIELSSYDDQNFDTDDEDGDDNHGLSSCGSAIRLNVFSSLEDSMGLEDNHSTLGYDLDSSMASSHSSQSRRLDQTQNQTQAEIVQAVDHDHLNKVTMDKEVEADGADMTPHIDNLKCSTDGTKTNDQPPHSKLSNFVNNQEDDMLDNEQNEQVFTLFQSGKEYYASGAYEDALQMQNEALQLIHHIAKEKDYQKDGGTSETMNTDKHLLQRQAAMVKFEIAKIKFVVYKENQYHQSAAEVSSSLNPNYDADARLSHLFDKMQHAKCLVSLQDFVYYRDQLAIMDRQGYGYSPALDTMKGSTTDNPTASTNKHANTTKQQQTNNNCTLTTTQQNNQPMLFDIEKITHKIEILNALGKLCHKDLHQYEDALRYHCEALELECAIVAFLTSNKSDENATSSSAIDNAEEIQEWKMKIQQTKKKMGAIYYLNGRFDMALLSSFSFQSPNSGSAYSAK